MEKGKATGKPDPGISFYWTGKAVSKNRAHMACAHVSSKRIINTPEYRQWVESMALQWMVERPPSPIAGPFDAHIVVEVGPRFDPQNVIDGVLDALQKGLIIQDDRNLRNLVFQSLSRHKQGAPDRLWARVSPGLLFYGRPKEEPDPSERSDKRRKRHGVS